MSESNTTPAAPSGFRKFLRALLRLVLFGLVTAVIITVVYLGVVYMLQNAVQPARVNAEQLRDLSTRQASRDEKSDERLDEMSQRLAELESQQDLNNEQFSGLKGDVEALNRAIGGQTNTLNRLELLEGQMDSVLQFISPLATGTVQETLVASNQQLRADMVLMQRELKALKALELINRARLFILQENYGKAGNDMEEAHQSLLALRDILPAESNGTIDLILQRLELALLNIETAPGMASDDLEIAWGLLLSNLPNAEASTANESITPTFTPTPYLTETSVLITPTPYVTPTPQTSPTSKPTVSNTAPAL
jgi:hypothetical protein